MSAKFVMLVALFVAVAFSCASAAETETGIKCYVCTGIGDSSDCGKSVDTTKIDDDEEELTNSTADDADDDITGTIIEKEDCKACSTSKSTAASVSTYVRACLSTASTKGTSCVTVSGVGTCTEICDTDLCNLEYSGGLGLAATPILMAISLLALVKNFYEI